MSVSTGESPLICEGNARSNRARVTIKSTTQKYDRRPEAKKSQSADDAYFSAITGRLMRFKKPSGLDVTSRRSRVRSMANAAFSVMNS